MSQSDHIGVLKSHAISATGTPCLKNVSPVLAQVNHLMDRCFARRHMTASAQTVPMSHNDVFFVCIKAEHIYFICIGLASNFLRYVWGPEAGVTAHLQSQGEGEAANPHRPVPQDNDVNRFQDRERYAPLVSMYLHMVSVSYQWYSGGQCELPVVLRRTV